MESKESSSSSSKASENGEKRKGSAKTDSEDGPQASKRERADKEAAAESSQVNGKQDNGNCSKNDDGVVDGQSCSSSFPRRSRQSSRNYRKSNDKSNKSSSSDEEMAPRSERAGVVSPSQNQAANADRGDEDGESESSAEDGESDSSAEDGERESLRRAFGSTIGAAVAERAFGNALIAALRNCRQEDEENGSNPPDSDDETDGPSVEDDSDSDSDVILDLGESSEFDNPEAPDISLIPCLLKEKPRHTWSVTKEVLARQYGTRNGLLAPQKFTQKFAGSLHCVQRLELMARLENHSGCVNTVQFNDTGDKIISGSDDKRVVVCNWSTGQKLLAYQSGHTSNIVQARFLHDCNDSHIVSCARDGQVRLAVLSSTGECRSTHRLAQHRRGAQKLGMHPETPRNVLSCGEDALIMSIDTRTKRAQTIVTVMENSKKLGLYSIHIHPTNHYEFCVSGVDRWIRIFDRRRIAPDFTPMKKFCPSNLRSSSSFYNVTSAVYSHDGTEIIGSYNDEDVYLFRTNGDHPGHPDHVFHRYEGHRNSSTVKSVNFFGPNSEFVISGSDCGNIFFWEKETESIVQFMRGDEMGVVNALVMHPQLPILATSGLDNDVKVWVPSCEVAPDLTTPCLRRVVTRNIRSKTYRYPHRSQSIRSPAVGAEMFLEVLRRAAVQPFLSSTDSSDENVNENPSHCPPS